MKDVFFWSAIVVLVVSLLMCCVFAYFCFIREDKEAKELERMARGRSTAPQVIVVKEERRDSW